MRTCGLTTSTVHGSIVVLVGLTLGDDVLRRDVRTRSNRTRCFLKSGILASDWLEWLSSDWLGLGFGG